MKMEILIGLTLCLVFISIPASAKLPDPLIEFKERDPMCDDKGQLTFWFGDPDSRGMEASDLRVFANFTKTDEVFEVPGDYFFGEKSVNVTPHYTMLVNNWYSVFRSKEGIFKHGGKYILTVSNKKLNKTVQKTFECTGLLFSCELVNVSIDKCFNKDGVFYAYFTGTGFHRQSKYSNAKEINITSELSYKMTGPKFQFIGNSPSIVVEELENQMYVLTYETDHTINTLDIIVLPCSSYNAKFSKACTASPECTSPSDCDDGDPCTRDLCTDNACVHEKTCKEGPMAEKPAKESESLGDTSEVATPEGQHLSESVTVDGVQEPQAGDGITGQVSAGNGDFISNLIGSLLSIFGL